MPAHLPPITGTPPAAASRPKDFADPLEEKAGAVRLALSDVGPVQLPAAGARGRQRTLFLLDRAAASRLPPQLGRTG